MSGYPSLISPLMDEQGLILTEALNTDAQTALALSATNEAAIIVLQETALQLSGDPAVYTGLPDTNLIIDGDITCGTLNYTALNPPVSVSETIEQVLTNGDDANGRDLTGLNNLACQSLATPALTSPVGYITSPSIVMPTGSLTCRNASSNGVIETNAIRVFSDAITYSAVISPEGTVFGSSYQMFGQVPSKFSVSNAGTTFTTKLEVDETLADSSSSVGTSGQILSSTGTGIQWINPSSENQSLGDVMTVGNTASTDLNMNSNNILGASSIVITNGETDITQSVSNMSQALEFTTPLGYASLKCDSINLDSLTTNSMYSVGNVSAGNLINNGLYFDASGSYGTAGQLLSSTGTATAWVNAPVSNPTLGDVMTNGNTASTDLNMNSNDITNAGLINGTNINYRPSYDYFVAKNGSDSNPGSILSPFLTVQKAIDVCEAFTDNVPRSINIFYGSYNENLTISKSRITFNGTNGGGSKADTGCSINGTITINVSSGLSDMNNNNIYFNNLFLGNVMSNTSSVVHRVGIKNCYLYNDQVKVIDFQPTADYRLFVDYCSISNADDTTSDTMVLCGGSGMVSFTSNQITQKGKGHVVSIQASCRIDAFALNILTNDNASAQCLAICKLGSTTANAVYTLGQNAFIYSSTTSKSSAAPYFSCGILMDPPATKTNFYNVISNTFLMTGLNNSLTNFAITGTRNASSFAYIFYGNNTGISSFLAPYSYQIDNGSGISKNALLAVQ